MSNEITEILLRKHDEMAQEVVSIKTSLAGIHITLGHITETLKDIKDDNLNTKMEVDRLKTDNNRMKGAMGAIGAVFIASISTIIGFFKHNI